MTECTQEYLEEKFRQFRDPNSEEEKIPEKVPKNIHSTEKLRRRNLIFDEEHFEDVFLRCLICREVFNESEKLPKTLPCHHSFCLHCFLQMFRVEGEYRQSLSSAFRSMPRAVKIQCPSCRDSIIASEDDLRRLPNDHTVLELINFVRETGINDISYCAKHQLQPLNFFCEPCAIPVCCDCTVLDHKNTNGHNVMNITEALSKYTPIINDTITEMEKSKQEYLFKRAQIEQSMKHLSQMETQVTDEIKLTFQKLRHMIDERERDILSMSEQEMNRKRQNLMDNFKKIIEREECMMDQMKELEIAKEANDISQMFTSHQAAQNTLSTPLQLPHITNDNFGVSFHFEAYKHRRVMQDLLNFGHLMVLSS
ncbi:tripartite motif-containing protein 59 isoform X3 [Octopus bimaculoides]|uniref:tripartite motif-containing protein 59 isoform X3 n=1 Tax=Octopus bimaculoides TaxID=37653 RepID=UPI0022E7D9BC|nr:tripartite motif-containing protein 59 isoform X3 [Octopus bimaculoides]